MKEIFSTSAYAVLRRLEDGVFYSGEHLARSLGVSRTAVWKAIQQLQGLGVRVDAVHGKGYRLAQPLELLSHDAITGILREPAAGYMRQCDILSVVDSTNQYLNRIAEDIHGRVCMAETQTHGKGRRGRQWVSPFAANIYLSMGWRFAQGLAATMGLSIALAVMVARALNTIRMPSLALKWPNDVLVGGKKVAGILIEASGEAQGECRLILGMGINVRMPAVVADIDQPWTDIHRHAGVVSRNRLSAALINEVVEGMTLFEREGLQAFVPQWRQYDCLFERQVVLLAGGGRYDGVARGIDSHGALLVERGGEIRPYYSGDVSVRLQPEDGGP